ncbi:hypothetical protein ACKLNR_014802 [Fusarium oxysporum f. sp. zingiberi]
MHNPYSQVCAIPQCNRPRKHFTTKISPWCQYHHAVRYALDAGLIDAGWVEDLEVKDPSPDLHKALQGVRRYQGHL